MMRRLDGQSRQPSHVADREALRDSFPRHRRLRLPARTAQKTAKRITSMRRPRALSPAGAYSYRGAVPNDLGPAANGQTWTANCRPSGTWPDYGRRLALFSGNRLADCFGDLARFRLVPGETL